MNPAIPEYVNIFFTLTTLLGVWLFKRAFKASQTTLIVLFFWLAIQGYLAYSGFYEDNMSLPPHFMLAAFPTFILMVVVFVTKKGKAFMDGLDLEDLHWIHVVRIPVEIALWLLFVANTIPELLTFEGRNLDIIAGLTAPIIIFYGIRKTILDKNRVLLWNAIGLFLLLNIIFMVIFSVETPFQRIHKNIATTGILSFPFVWLPSFLAPMVLFSHLVSIRLLLASRASANK